VDLDLDRARWRTTVAYRPHPRFQLGIEWNPAADEVAPIATWFVLTEEARRPAVYLGVSTDRIGSPEGTLSYSATAAKNLGRRFGVYGSLMYSEWDRDIVFPFGATIDLGAGFSARPLYDGAKASFALGYSRGAMNVSLLWIWFERAGVSVSWGF
jgi:hypothetical protein